MTHTGVLVCSKKVRSSNPGKPFSTPIQMINQKSNHMLPLFRIRGHQCGPITNLGFANLAPSKLDREDDSGFQRRHLLVTTAAALSDVTFCCHSRLARPQVLTVDLAGICFPISIRKADQELTVLWNELQIVFRTLPWGLK